MVNLQSRFAIYFKSKGETRYAFGKRVGISPSTIDNYLQGDRVPNADVLTKIFDSDPKLSPLWFFTDRDDVPMYLDEPTPAQSSKNEQETIKELEARLSALESENNSLKEQLKDKDKIIKVLIDKVD